ncbi:MAG TPA: 2-oxo-4-hydroxy-4-carboxy-5-ureidoimidazoline decarboxylase [Micromonosporaceae bacterium]
MSRDDAGLARLNALPAALAEADLRACCASPDWVAAMMAGRPYPDRAALVRQGEQVLAGLDWPGIEQALAAHPRIGERMAGRGRESAWSSQEQSGMGQASEATRAALVAANQAYEARFGHVFLICATGLSDAQMLAEARRRVHHDEATERGVVRAELGRIVALRLAKLLDAEVGP